MKKMLSYIFLMCTKYYVLYNITNTTFLFIFKLEYLSFPKMSLPNPNISIEINESSIGGIERKK